MMLCWGASVPDLLSVKRRLSEEIRGLASEHIGGLGE
jgi:hypothetical protein